MTIAPHFGTDTYQLSVTHLPHGFSSECQDGKFWKAGIIRERLERIGGIALDGLLLSIASPRGELVIRFRTALLSEAAARKIDIAIREVPGFESVHTSKATLTQRSPPRPSFEDDLWDEWEVPPAPTDAPLTNPLNLRSHPPVYFERIMCDG